jgi:hypothetical protein
MKNSFTEIKLKAKHNNSVKSSKKPARDSEESDDDSGKQNNKSSKKFDENFAIHRKSFNSLQVTKVT